jgi:hypothetical protein
LLGEHHRQSVLRVRSACDVTVPREVAQRGHEQRKGGIEVADRRLVPGCRELRRGEHEQVDGLALATAADSEGLQRAGRVPQQCRGATIDCSRPSHDDVVEVAQEQVANDDRVLSA